MARSPIISAVCGRGNGKSVAADQPVYVTGLAVGMRSGGEPLLDPAPVCPSPRRVTAPGMLRTGRSACWDGRRAIRRCCGRRARWGRPRSTRSCRAGTSCARCPAVRARRSPSGRDARTSRIGRRVSGKHPRAPPGRPARRASWRGFAYPGSGAGEAPVMHSCFLRPVLMILDRGSPP